MAATIPSAETVEQHRLVQQIIWFCIVPCRRRCVSDRLITAVPAIVVQVLQIISKVSPPHSPRDKTSFSCAQNVHFHIFSEQTANRRLCIVVIWHASHGIAGCVIHEAIVEDCPSNSITAAIASTSICVHHFAIRQSYTNRRVLEWRQRWRHHRCDQQSFFQSKWPFDAIFRLFERWQIRENR